MQRHPLKRLKDLDYQKVGLQKQAQNLVKKKSGIDQGFSFDRINIGEFYMPGFDVCLEAENMKFLSDKNLETIIGKRAAQIQHSTAET